jgi:hypothetical protein
MIASLAELGTVDLRRIGAGFLQTQDVGCALIQKAQDEW